jgi:uncharacterized membrane protein YedE/YeeE
MDMLRTLLFGTLFGFILSRAGVTDYDTMTQMFLLEEWHVMGVMGIAMIIAGTGMFLLKKMNVKTFEGKPLPIEKKPLNKGNLWGGLLFGAGWAITATCPGTVLVQLGEGKLTALFTISGIFLGTLLFRAYDRAKQTKRVPAGGLRSAA